MMDYTNGDTVVVNHFGKNKVGTITERQKTVKGYRYLVKTEDGREVRIYMLIIVLIHHI